MPNCGLAMHIDPRGRRALAGGRVVITYSRPSRVKPPRPLKNCSSRAAAIRRRRAARCGALRGRRQAAASAISARPRRSTCSASVPPLSLEDDARHGLQQHAVFLGHLLGAADEDAAGLVDQPAPRCRRRSGP